ncbi:MAG: hypothetical protein ACFFC1_06450, partial [Promethearchaeota archaeon]
NIDLELISQILLYMNDPTANVRASVFEILAKIGNFKKFLIPITPLFDGLVDSDENVRISAVQALKKYFDENPKALDVDMIINKIDPSNTKILKNVINLLGDLWEKDPEKILTILLIFIKLKDNELKNEISKILIAMYPKSPDLIFENLIKIKDESKFISKGIISSTIIEIARKNPDIVIPKLLNFVHSDNDDIILNSIVSLEGLVDEYLHNIDRNAILSIFQKPYNINAKKEGSQLISRIAKIDPIYLKSVINELLQLQYKQDLSVRVILTKSLLEIAKRQPNLIPVSTIINLYSDKDSFIRETSVKILGFIGYKVPLEAVNVLLNKALIDEEWIVRDAAVSSLGMIIQKIDDKRQIIENLVELMNDKNNWVRNSSMNLIASIKNIDSSVIPIEKVLGNLYHEDSKVRQGAANLLKIYDFDIIDDNFERVLVLLGDESDDVRRSIINTMIEVIQKVGLSKILSRLLKNLSDSSSLVTQQSIALILGRTAKYEDEKIRKRIIALLKVRCEMSQDPIICETLAKLKEA